MFFGRRNDATDSWKIHGAGDELREHPRMELKTLVTVRALGKEAHCRLHDISLGGLAFVAPWKLPPNTPVSLELPPPKGLQKAPKGTAAVEARVCRVIPSPRYAGSFQTGARFIHPSLEAQAIIRLWFETFGESPESRAKSGKNA